ncbi:MAG: hypothetical protein KDA89_19045, partial [Planctomycetaceae bacterium]|nr:hypothetical protein [Planctomycetaceae bacterium]
MSTGLDPVVIHRLRQFAQRRRLMLLIRGICAAVVGLILGMLAVAAADWYWLLSDQTRWTLSSAAYAGAVLAAWTVAFRRFFAIRRDREIAAAVEQAAPELRESLLSAVELAADDPEAIHDSPAFRQLLQGHVAEHMLNVRIGDLLPSRLLFRWLLLAVVVGGIVVVLLSTGGDRMRQLAMRAVLPGANIARVSRIQVEVLQPGRTSLTLPENETLAIVVAVTGGSVSDVILETLVGDNDQSNQLSMRADSGTALLQTTSGQNSDGESSLTSSHGTSAALAQGGRYVSNFRVGRESVRYRILAGDAVTEWFEIASRTRPQVTDFRKTYHYPDYAQLPNRIENDDNGDLISLAGSRAELLLTVDQKMSAAELRISPHGSADV